MLFLAENIKKAFIDMGRYKSICFLLLYYGIAQWLPDSFNKRLLGHLSDLLRVYCCRHLFASTGKNIHIGRRAYCGKGKYVKIGNNSNIGAYCHVPSDIEIGTDVMMGPHSYFSESVTHQFSRVDIPMIQQGVVPVAGHIVIGDDVWVGRSCLVLPCKEIGSHTVIGAGSVVSKNIPDYVVAVGNPCRIIRKRSVNQ